MKAQEDTRRKQEEISILSCVIILICSSTVYASIYPVPLNVNGYYEFSGYIEFSIDVGVQFSEIHDIRFQAQGDITAVDAPGLFGCTLIAGSSERQHASSPEIPPSDPPVSVPFGCDSTFTASNGATWDFLLDGNANGYVMLTTSILYAPEFPPEDITGNITSASLLIDATPIPEPTIILFLTMGIAGVCANKSK